MENLLTFAVNRSITAAASVAAVAAMTLTACGGSGTTAANTPLGSSSSTTAAASTSSAATASGSSTSSSSTATAVAPTRAAQPQVARSQARPVLKLTTSTQSLAFGVVRHTDSSLAKGKIEVTRNGVAGIQRVTVTNTVFNGKVTRSVITKRETVKAPVAKVITVGTKTVAPKPVAPKRTTTTTPRTTAPSTGGLDLRRAAMWDRIAQCESTGNWSINTGNGYYGGLQFDIGTWLGAGGGRFAARPDLASRAQQITIANKVYDSRGLGPWGCAHAA
ncbi:transglycosylase family protein [Calidifontibacter terrae]